MTTHRVTVLRSIATAAAKAMSGSFAYALFQTVALAVITQTGGAGDAANWFLAQAIATPIASFASLRLRDQLAVEPVSSSFVHRMVRSWTISAVVGVLATVLWVSFGSGQLRVVGIAILWSNFAQQSIQAFQGRRARSGQLLAPSQLSTLLGAAALVSVVIGYRIGGLASGTVLLAISWWGIALFPIVREIIAEAKAGTPPSTDVSVIDDVAVGLSAAARNSQISVARIGAGAFAGEAALAALGTASFFVRLGVLAVGGIRAAISPRLAQARAAGTLAHRVATLRTQSRLAMIVGSLLGFAAAYAGGSQIIELIFGAETAPTRATTGIVFGSAVLLYGSMILGQVVIAYDRRWALARATFAALTATATTIGPLAIVYGEEGAALSLGFGYLVRYIFVDRALAPELVPLRRRTLALLFAPFAIISAFSYWAVYQMLVPEERLPTGNVDAIVVLAGGSGERLERGLELLEEYPTAVLMISIPPEPPKFDSGRLARSLCDNAADDIELVVCFDVWPDSTAGEAASAARSASENGFESIVLVSSDLHMARAARWFGRCGVDVYTAPAETEFSRWRFRREWIATVDSVLFQRSCPDPTRPADFLVDSPGPHRDH